MTRSALRLFIAVVPACLGCGGQEGPETVDVTGVVTLNGDPVDNADVFFHPVDANGPGQACQAVTDADGRFTVRTHVQAGEYTPGMIPAGYRVSISKLDTSRVTSPFTPPENVLPEKYASPATSGYQVQVSAEKVNDFEFPLQE